METYKMILFICLAQVFLSGCSKKSPSIEDDSLRVKVYNSSNYTLKNIEFLAQSLKIEEDLMPGESSSIYKLTPFGADRREDSKVSSFIGVDINDYNVGQYITLKDKILNNVYVSADSVNNTRGPQIIISVRVE